MRVSGLGFRLYPLLHNGDNIGFACVYGLES